MRECVRRRARGVIAVQRRKIVSGIGAVGDYLPAIVFHEVDDGYARGIVLGKAPNWRVARKRRTFEESAPAVAGQKSRRSAEQRERVLGVFERKASGHPFIRLPSVLRAESGERACRGADERCGDDHGYDSRRREIASRGRSHFPPPHCRHYSTNFDTNGQKKGKTPFRRPARLLSSTNAYRAKTLLT